MAPLKILIVGCSIAGPALAILLLLGPESAPQKPHITILERAPSLRTNGQNIDIRPLGAAVIRKLGLEFAVRASTTGEVGVQWVDAKNQVWAALGATNDGPTSDIEIMRGRLAELLYERSKQLSEEVQREGGAGIEYIFGDHLNEHDSQQSEVNVHFARSGVRRTFHIVVGADGLQSSTRKMVWGEQDEVRRIKHLNAYSAFFSMPPGPTDSNWRRWFHATSRRGIMVRPDKYRGKSTALMTIVNDKDARLSTVSREGVAKQKELMREYFQDVGWESDRILNEMDATDDFYYDIVGQVKMESLGESWSKGTVVLLGDAGYCASPFSGMGTTLALMGAYHLAGAILRHSDSTHPAAAFPEYERKMRPIVDAAQKLVPGMPHILHPETAWGVWMTNALVYAMSISGLLKLIFALKGGASADAVVLEDYGFRQLPEWKE